MILTKTIKFYTFEPQPSIINNGITPLTTFQIFAETFPKCDFYPMLFEGEDYVIDILKQNSQYIFGKCAKANELTYNRFYQVRDKQTYETAPYQSDSEDNRLEVYTFFCIDCNSSRIAAIQHKSINKLNIILSAAIEKYSKNTLYVNIYPERIRDIRKAYRKIKKNPKLTIAFAKDKQSKYNIDSLSEALGGIAYDQFSVDFKLSTLNNDSSITKMLDIFQKDKDSFSSIKLTGKNEYGYDEIVDFVETLYTRTTSFDLSDDFTKNYDIIEQELIKSLSIEQ